MAKKLKDLGGKKYEEFSSISAAQKAGSIYYGKKLKSGEIKKKAAVLSTDLSKGQSLRSFINEKLKGSESTGANYKVKGAKNVRPKLRPKIGMQPIVDPDGQDVGKDYYTNPKKVADISRKEMLKIIKEGEKRPLPDKTPRTGIEPPSKNGGPKKTKVLKPDEKKKTALETKVEKATNGLTGNAKKLAAWKAGQRTLTMRERGRLYRWARGAGISVPKSLYDIPDNYK